MTARRRNMKECEVLMVHKVQVSASKERRAYEVFILCKWFVVDCNLRSISLSLLLPSLSLPSFSLPSPSLSLSLPLALSFAFTPLYLSLVSHRSLALSHSLSIFLSSLLSQCDQVLVCRRGTASLSLGTGLSVHSQGNSKEK
jgi:hypothetical protein